MAHSGHGRTSQWRFLHARNSRDSLFGKPPPRPNEMSRRMSCTTGPTTTLGATSTTSVSVLRPNSSTRTTRPSTLLRVRSVVSFCEAVRDPTISRQDPPFHRVDKCPPANTTRQKALVKPALSANLFPQQLGEGASLSAIVRPLVLVALEVHRLSLSGRSNTWHQFVPVVLGNGQVCTMATPMKPPIERFHLLLTPLRGSPLRSHPLWLPD